MSSVINKEMVEDSIRAARIDLVSVFLDQSYLMCLKIYKRTKGVKTEDLVFEFAYIAS